MSNTSQNKLGFGQFSADHMSGQMNVSVNRIGTNGGVTIYGPMGDLDDGLSGKDQIKAKALEMLDEVRAFIEAS